VVEDKNKLLKPILSRFSEFYCNKKINLLKDINTSYKLCQKKVASLAKFLEVNKDIKLNLIANKLYNNAYSGNNLIEYIETKFSNDMNKYIFLILIDTYKKYIRDEKIILLFCLNYIFFRSNINIKNIYFI
jgi:hypothetical protein